MPEIRPIKRVTTTPGDGLQNFEDGDQVPQALVALGYGIAQTTAFHDINQSTPTNIDFDTAVKFVGGVVDQPNDDEMRILVAGDYKVHYSVSGDSNDNNRKNVKAVLRVNGADVDRSEAHGYSRNIDDEDLTCVNTTIIPNMSVNDIITLVTYAVGTGGVSVLTSAQIIVEKMNG